jgi:hypothetical protein
MAGGPIITGKQAEATRKLLGWPRAELSSRIGVNVLVLANFEQRGFLALSSASCGRSSKTRGSNFPKARHRASRQAS